MTGKLARPVTHHNRASQALAPACAPSYSWHMSADSRPLPSATSLLAATVTAGSIAFTLATRVSTPVALVAAGGAGLLIGLAVQRPSSKRRPDGRLTFRTPDQLVQARERLVQARAVHADTLRERQGVRRRLNDLLARMRQAGLTAYSTRIATIERGLVTLDRQIAVISKLRDGYDRSLRMVEIELDAGHAAELLDQDISAAIGDALYELRLLEESQADLGRQLAANDEVEGLLR